ncbi:MAG: helix-turn-helix domain-containing protein [Propionibacteriaceae bacterium]
MTSAEPTGADLAALGARVRGLRARRGLSLSGLAADAGIGKGSLSELEAGRRNPTLATLYALAGPLGVPLTTLLADETGTEVSADGLSATLLGVERLDNDSIVEVYRLRFDRDADRRSPAHGPGVREHLLLTQGRLAVEHRDGTAELAAGDTVTFSSETAHRYRVLGGERGRAVLVITSPGRASGFGPARPSNTP